ncbi:MAG: alpha/beta hydrolase [Pseudomonadota bacterium]
MKNDEAYNNRDHIPDADGFISGWEAAAQEFRQSEAAIGRARLNTAYGAHEREKFDLFYPAGRAQGLVVFIHGGYWRLFDRGYWSHFAQGATARDWAVAMPSYPLCPEVRIADITRSAAAAIQAAAARVAGPITLAGHSAGGHLVARMANGDTALSSETLARVKKILPISPVTDLRPLIETEMNADFRLDAASALAESPALRPKARGIPVSVFVGGDERPAFLDQARWLEQAWADTQLTIVQGRHHFDVIDALKDPESGMIEALLG